MAPAAAPWFDLILGFACITTADDDLKGYIQMANARGDMVFPTLPIDALPR